MTAVRLIIDYRSFSNKNDRHHHHRPIGVAAGSVTSTAALWIMCAGDGRQQPQGRSHLNAPTTSAVPPSIEYFRALLFSSVSLQLPSFIICIHPACDDDENCSSSSNQHQSQSQYKWWLRLDFSSSSSYLLFPLDVLNQSTSAAAEADWRKDRNAIAPATSDPSSCYCSLENIWKYWCRSHHHKWNEVRQSGRQEGRRVVQYVPYRRGWWHCCCAAVFG